jgi:hypothetical protein
MPTTTTLEDQIRELDEVAVNSAIYYRDKGIDEMYKYWEGKHNAYMDVLDRL